MCVLMICAGFQCVYLVQTLEDLRWSLSCTMTKAGAIKLSILFFLIFILCLPEFFPQVSQLQFLCETVDPCTSENVSVDVRVCGQDDFPCATEVRNASSLDGPTGWYLCKPEMDSHVPHDNKSVSGGHAMVVLTLKGDNISKWNVSVFVFLNHTDLYAGHQRLLYCILMPNKSICPDMNISTEENFGPPRLLTSTSKTTTSAKPETSSLFNKTVLSLKEMGFMQNLICHPSSSGHLFHHLENNQTARSATFLRTQTKKESWWCVTTAVWFTLVLILIIIALTSVGCLVSKSRRAYQRKSHLVAVLARNYLLKEISMQRGNMTRNVPDVSVAVCSASEHLLKVNAPYIGRLSAIYEITENSLNEDCNEGVEEEKPNSLVTKQEFKESLGHCQTSAHLHHRSNPSCSCHETDGEL